MFQDSEWFPASLIHTKLSTWPRWGALVLTTRATRDLSVLRILRTRAPKREKGPGSARGCDHFVGFDAGRGRYGFRVTRRQKALGPCSLLALAETSHRA